MKEINDLMEEHDFNEVEKEVMARHYRKYNRHNLPTEKFFHMINDSMFFKLDVLKEHARNLSRELFHDFATTLHHVASLFK